MTHYPIHEDLKKYEKVKFPIQKWLLPIMNGFLDLGNRMTKPLAGVKVTRKVITGYKNGKVPIAIYEPISGQFATTNVKELPCLVYFHGGAFVLKAAPFHQKLVCEYALQTPCKVVFVDYRLAPKYAFPYGVEDCYAAVEWVHKNANQLGIDPSRIALGGDSAGGALAAAVTMMMRDRKSVSICFQMLVYPVTDARQSSPSMLKFIDTPIWNAGLTRKMWQYYLKDEMPISRAYASPLEATNFENLPDAYVEVAEFDCLKDEGVLYAKALEQAGSQVTLNGTVGTVHGFEIAYESVLVKEQIRKRGDALRQGLYR